MSGFRISALAVAVVAAVSANQVAANISVTIPTVETVSGSRCSTGARATSLPKGQPSDRRLLEYRRGLRGHID